MWMNALFWPGPLRVHPCAYLRAHSTTFDWISQRETSILSASPFLLWLRATLLIHNSSISSPCPNLLDGLLSHSQGWSPPPPCSCETSVFNSPFAHPPSGLCLCQVVCVFSTNVFLSYLNLQPLLLVFSLRLFYPPSLCCPVFSSVDLWLYFAVWVSLMLSIRKLDHGWFLSICEDQLALIAFAKE